MNTKEPQTGARPPTADEIAQLPPHAVVAFTARCARIAQPLYRHACSEWFTYRNELDDAISLVELIAGNADAPTAILPQLTQLAHRETSQFEASIVFDGNESEDACCIAAKSTRVIDSALRSAQAMLADNSKLYEIAATAAEFACIADVYVQEHLTSEVLHAFDTLLATAKTQQWQHSVLVPRSLFLLNARFDIPTGGEFNSIVSVASRVDDVLVEKLKLHPEIIYALQPGEFEELVAKLFSGIGYQVERTQMTRDGGYDLAAIRKSEVGHLRFLLECKRYAPTRPVTVSAVRALHGVVQSQHATKGILVTTSRFTGPALQHFEDNKHILEPRDFAGFLDWLDIYDRYRLQSYTRRRTPGEET
jgi:HJR/Mrr/RecB family endonuclease